MPRRIVVGKPLTAAVKADGQGVWRACHSEHTIESNGEPRPRRRYFIHDRRRAPVSPLGEVKGVEVDGVREGYATRDARRALAVLQAERRRDARAEREVSAPKTPAAVKSMMRYWGV